VAVCPGTCFDGRTTLYGDGALWGRAANSRFALTLSSPGHVVDAEVCADHAPGRHDVDLGPWASAAARDVPAAAGGDPAGRVVTLPFFR